MRNRKQLVGKRERSLVRGREKTDDVRNLEVDTVRLRIKKELRTARREGQSYRTGGEPKGTRS